MRSRAPDEPWLIPVRFDNCDIPDIDVGGGRTLASIQRSDLFGDNADAQAGRLVAAVQRILGRATDNAATHSPTPARPRWRRLTVPAASALIVALAALLAFEALGGPAGPALHRTSPTPPPAAPEATFQDLRGTGVAAVAFSPGGGILAVGDTNGGTYLWDVVSRTVIARLADPQSRGVDGVALSPGGGILAATAASKALPPASSTAMPTADASQCVEATIPNVPASCGLVVNC